MYVWEFLLVCTTFGVHTTLLLVNCVHTRLSKAMCVGGRFLSGEVCSGLLQIGGGGRCTKNDGWMVVC